MRLPLSRKMRKASQVVLSQRIGGSTCQNPHLGRRVVLFHWLHDHQVSHGVGEALQLFALILHKHFLTHQSETRKQKDQACQRKKESSKAPTSRRNGQLATWEAWGRYVCVCVFESEISDSLEDPAGNERLDRRRSRGIDEKTLQTHHSATHPTWR